MMKQLGKISSLLILIVGFSYYSFAEKAPGSGKKSGKSLTAGCPMPSAFTFLDLNNVRARINTGGDM